MKFLFLVLTISISFTCMGQIDSSFIARAKYLDTADLLKLDTTAVPNDSFTKKIKKMRAMRKGISFEIVLQLKLREEQEKDKTHSKEFYEALSKELTSGRINTLIENSLVNLYRRSFTEKEMKQLIRFYKTPAGKKMNSEFILLLAESVKVGEQLLKMAVKKIEQEQVK